MSAGTATGLIIAGGIAAGASTATGIYAAKKGADAAKQASQIQVDASNKAMEYQQQAQQNALAYLNNARNNATYAPAGPAQTYLSKLMGVPGGANFNPQPSAPPPAFPGRSPTGPSMTQPYAIPPPSTPNMGYAQPQGGMVMLEAPTGERRSVPADQAQALIARGAKQVS